MVSYDKVLDKQKCIGIVYAQSRGIYTIKIHDHGEEIIPTGWLKGPKHFECIEDAKEILKKHHVEKAYMAMDSTYDEFGQVENKANITKQDQNAYDFMPISLE